MCRRKPSSFGRFEALEERRMMAGDISFSNRTITINGAGLNDVAVVRFEGNRVYADIDVQEIDEDGELDIDDHDTDKRISDVSRIVFNGFAGNDSLNVVVNQLNSGTTLNNITLEFHGGDNDDVLTNQLLGGVKTVAFGDAGNDTLQGSKFDDILEGGTGNDSLSGAGGNDTYVFAGSEALGIDEIMNEAANVNTDTLDFSHADIGYILNVDLEAVYSGANPKYAVSATRDGLQVKLGNATAIENVIGSQSLNILRGNSRPNRLVGGAIADILEGRGGDDVLEGRGGSDDYKFRGGNLGTDTIIEAGNADHDLLDFSDFGRGVTVDISKYGGLYAVNNSDLKLKLSSGTGIEDVWGSMYDDVITGNSRDNWIDGYDGNDTLTGGAGADILSGGKGDDMLFTDALDAAYGNEGRDWFDKTREPVNPDQSNPRPGRYKDWGFDAGGPRASERIPTLLG